jgi:ATP-dependent RNA helicase DDX10/DBP4
VLLKIGSSHLFSAGMVVGGKKEFHLEQTKIGRTNIIIATPGRLLQHLEQTPDFDVGSLLMLVLDEAGTYLNDDCQDMLENSFHTSTMSQHVFFTQIGF